MLPIAFCTIILCLCFLVVFPYSCHWKNKIKFKDVGTWTSTKHKKKQEDTEEGKVLLI